VERRWPGKKAMGEALSEVLPGSSEPGIRGTPSSGSRYIFFNDNKRQLETDNCFEFCQFPEIQNHYVPTRIVGATGSAS
jgi:hypothetical protein